MTIQEILAAQNRAANLCRKGKPAAYSKPVAKPTDSVPDILAAQRNACARKAAPTQVPVKEISAGVASIIEKQCAAVAAQKGEAALSKSQKEIIDDVKKRYNKFLKKLDKELEGQELRMPQPVDIVKPVEPVAEPETEQAGKVFVPNFPAGPEVAVEPVAPGSPVNGISVGDEMGGQVAIGTRSRRRRKMRLGNV